MTPPMPIPSTSMYRASRAVDVCTPIRCSRNRPTVMNAGAGDREEPVLAGPGDDLPGGDRDQQQPGHQREQVQPGDGRRDAADDLEERRQVRDRAEHREADDEADQAGHREGAQLEQVQWQHRLGRPAARPARTRRPAATPATPRMIDRRRPPRVGGAAQAGQQDQRGDGQRQHGGAEVVDHVVHPAQRGTCSTAATTTSAITPIGTLM